MVMKRPSSADELDAVLVALDAGPVTGVARLIERAAAHHAGRAPSSAEPLALAAAVRRQVHAGRIKARPHGQSVRLAITRSGRRQLKRRSDQPATASRMSALAAASVAAIATAACSTHQVAPTQHHSSLLPLPPLFRVAEPAGLQQVRDESGRLLFVPCSPCNGPTPKVAEAQIEKIAPVPSVMARIAADQAQPLRPESRAAPAIPQEPPALPVSALIAAADMSAADIRALLAPPNGLSAPIETTARQGGTGQASASGAPPAVPQATRLVQASRQFVVDSPASAPLRADQPRSAPASGTAVVLFDHAQSRLTEHGRASIMALAAAVPKGAIVYVRGTTDSTGDPVKNEILARNRAAVVRALLMANGVARANIKTDFCTSCFVDGNDTEEGRRANRRVDISVGQPPAVRAPGLPSLGSTSA